MDNTYEPASTNAKTEYHWDAERFRYLLTRANMSVQDFSKATGITKSSAITYTKGAVPGYSAMCRIADYFCVPLDYLAGRLSSDEEVLVRENFYSWYAAKERRLFEKSYLEYTASSSRFTPKAYEAAIHLYEIRLIWPYNLIYDVQRAKDFELPLQISSEDQIKGIEEAMKTLNDRERDILYAKYKEGLTLNDLGKKYGLTRERIRQIILIGVGKLTLPGAFEYIRDGYRGCGCIQKKERLARLEGELEKLIRNDEEFKDALLQNGRLRELYKRYQKDRDKVQSLNVTSCISPELKDLPLSVLKLSARPNNVLKRNGAKTVADVIAMADNDQLMSFTNMGRKSEEEILEAIAVYRNKDNTASAAV